MEEPPARCVPSAEALDQKRSDTMGDADMAETESAGAWISIEPQAPM